MRSLSRSLLPICVLGMLAPLAASAQDYTPSFRLKPYAALDPADPTVTVLPFTGMTSLSGVNLPFSVPFYGRAFNQINISRHGYVTFSSRPGVDELSGGLSDPAVSNNQFPLPDPAAPNGVIAAWWDNLICPVGTIKTRTAVIDNRPTFTVEWNGCHSSTNSYATVQMQLRFTKDSPVIVAHYGSMGSHSGNDPYSATAGVESPPRWTQVGGSWTVVNPGGDQGATPTFDPACNPGAGCGRDSWPTDTVIRYGRPDAADLAAGPNPDTGDLGLVITGITGSRTVTIALENNIENYGLTNAHGVTWDYYVSTGATLAPEGDRKLTCSRTTGVSIPATQIVTATDSCVVTLDPGYYRICTYLDPPTSGSSNGAIIEDDELNNIYCSDAFAIGIDLVGSMTIAGVDGAAGGILASAIHIENRGIDPAPDFQVQVWLRDCEASTAIHDVLAWETTIDLAGGASWHRLVDVPIRLDSRGDSICAVLALDPNDTVREIDEFNNAFTTCEAHGTSPKTCAAIARPDLEIRQLSARLPHGCFFGEPITFEAELCNIEPVEARGFGVGYVLDTNLLVSIADTLIVSIPQSCAVPGDCVAPGDGAPACVRGICHTPCLTDADCGNGDLECKPSFDLEVPGDTCQLVLPGHTCRSIQVTANLPTVNTQDNLPFDNGWFYFSAIADWTDAVTEPTRDTVNFDSITGATMCWIRQPDFQAVEVRTMPSLAPGELFPVYRRVRNLGVVPSDYTYRYVLSSNPFISENDLRLEIEGTGPIGESFVGARADDQGTDMVRLPAGIITGTHYLGIILDPLGQVAETNETDNNGMSAPVEVVDASLRILTTNLRNGTSGVEYNVQLLAAGGAGRYEWRLGAESTLPVGLELGPKGLLHGTPLEPGIYTFRIRVESAGNRAERLYALDVTQASGPLAITLAELPPAFAGVDYRVALGASGGLPPYSWACEGRPIWLDLTNQFLHGRPSKVADTVAITCTVTDKNRVEAVGSYGLAVHPTNGLRISSQEYAGGDIGEEFESCASAEGGSGEYLWSFVAATVPPGVSFGTLNNAGCLSGAPSACGVWLVDVTVADRASGLTDTRRLPLTVGCGALRLLTPSLPSVVRGSEYPSVQLQTDASDPVAFELIHGQLPAGLSLTVDGAIGGRVSIDTRSGDHDFAVHFRDATGRGGVGAATIHILPEATRDPTITTTKDSGCSAGGEAPAPGLLPLAALLAVLFFRRHGAVRPAATGLAAAALLLPSMASAQFVPGYATYHHAKPYESLPPESWILDPTTKNASFAITLDGWTVPFFGQVYSTFWAHENGLLLFSGHHVADAAYKIPYATSLSPRNFIAGWWDDHTMQGRPGDFRWWLRGTAPNREVVVGWKWLTASTTDGDNGGEHQISIREDGTIAIRWGEIVGVVSHNAVVGLMDVRASGRSMPFLSCSDYSSGVSSNVNCTAGDWNRYLRNTEAVFTTLPNLQIRSSSTNYEGRTGIDQPFRATLYNYGPDPVTSKGRFYVSTDLALSANAMPIGTSGPVTVGAFAEAEVELTAALPRGLDASRHYLFAVVDPDDQVVEYNEDDNVGDPFELQVLKAIPDLAVLWFVAPSSGAPGSTITVKFAVENVGNEDARDFPFAVVLSDNDAISGSDFVLHDESTISAGWLQTVETTVTVALPLETPPGVYRIGVVLDPRGTVEEFDKLNNTAGSDQTFVVAVHGLTILTVIPERVQVGTDFCIPLEAEGGDGAYTWRLVEGQLPPGIELDPGGDAGLASLCGRPRGIGIHDFTLEVSSGNLSARAPLTIEVTHDVLGLAVAANELPTAQFQVPYESGLTAFGGTGPYRWKVTGGALPAGLSFHDDGLVFGAPLEAGSFSLQVRVTDSDDRTADETVTLLVTPPPRVTCSSRTLGTLTLGAPFSARLLAAGGDGSYEWKTLGTSRHGDPDALPLDPLEPPPGLELASSGQITGTPAQVGHYLWILSVGVLGGTESDTCAITVDVVGGQGLTVTTVALQNAVPGKEYLAQLEAIGGEGELVWSLAGVSTLPVSLALETNGILHGTPAALEDAGSRTVSLLVEVRDARNLKGFAALSLTLAPETEGKITVIEREENGCRTAGGDIGLTGLALVFLALRRRR